MAENVINHDEVRLEIDPLLDTAREGVTALEKASSLIHIPTREMAKIQTAIKKMREAVVYIDNRAHILPVRSNATTKSALKEALKDATQEQIERAYTILSGQDAAYEMPALDGREFHAYSASGVVLQQAKALLSGQDAAYEMPAEELSEGGAMAEEAYYEVTPEGDEE